MTIHLDLLELPDGSYLVKSPQFAAWKFQQADRDDLKWRAERSLREYMAEHIQLAWCGWDGRP